MHLVIQVNELHAVKGTIFVHIKSLSATNNHAGPNWPQPPTTIITTTSKACKEKTPLSWSTICAMVLLCPSEAVGIAHHRWMKSQQMEEEKCQEKGWDDEEEEEGNRDWSRCTFPLSSDYGLSDGGDGEGRGVPSKLSSLPFFFLVRPTSSPGCGSSLNFFALSFSLSVLLLFLLSHCARRFA